MPSIAHLPRTQQRFIVWFTPMAWLATNAITPVVYYAKLKHERVETRQREMLVTQEVCRQIVSGTLSFLTSVGGIVLGGLWARWTRNPGAKTVSQLIGGTLATCFGFAFVRPILGTDLFVHWMRRQGKLAFGKGQDLGQSTAKSPLEMRRQAFWREVSHRQQTRSFRLG